MSAVCLQFFGGKKQDLGVPLILIYTEAFLQIVVNCGISAQNVGGEMVKRLNVTMKRKFKVLYI